MSYNNCNAAKNPFNLIISENKSRKGAIMTYNGINNCVNNNRKSKIMLILYAIVCITLIYIFYVGSFIAFNNCSMSSPLDMDFVTLKADDDASSSSFVSSEEVVSCQLPKLNPFEPSILEYMSFLNKIDCSKNGTSPMIFTTDFDSNLIILQDPKDFGLENCCYKPFERVDENSIRYIKSCSPINSTIEKLQFPIEYEFISIFCTNTSTNSSQLIDMFNFVPLKSPKSKSNNLTATFNKTNIQDETNLNIIILGLDAISHMNFQRTMPATFNYLSQNLSAISMNGYTKVGDNTFPNLVPALMGLSTGELENSCWNKDGINYSKYFDDCLFIWNNFSLEGYLTSYAEDAALISTFNYLKAGFNSTPTDYYLRTLTHALDQTLGHSNPLNANLCYGPRLGFSILLNNLQKVAYTLQNAKQKYFQFTWATSLFHDELTNPKHGDLALLQMLEWFKEHNYLENSIMVLMSDHGIRWGGIRATFQGRIEERMPFLYFILPNWFQSKYPKAVQNLKANSNKLSTPFDLHETLKDLLNFGQFLQDDKIIARSQELLEKNEVGLSPRGISLFLPISPGRDCSSAHIANHWCVCHLMEEIPVSSNKVVNASYVVVQILNNEILVNQSPPCAALELDLIMNAQQLQTTAFSIDNNKHLKRDDYQEDESQEELGDILTLTFKTRPGHAIFEVTTLKDNHGNWKLSGEISRINLYGNDSYCVSDYNLKKYCYCI